MGFFTKKPKKNKIYSLQEAMRLVNENEGYSVVEEGSGYKIIPDAVASSYIERYKDRNREKERLMFQESLHSGVSNIQINVNQEGNPSYLHGYSYSSEER